MPCTVRPRVNNTKKIFLSISTKSESENSWKFTDLLVFYQGIELRNAMSECTHYVSLLAITSITVKISITLTEQRCHYYILNRKSPSLQRITTCNKYLKNTMLYSVDFLRTEIMSDLKLKYRIQADRQAFSMIFWGGWPHVCYMKIKYSVFRKKTKEK